MKVLRRPYRQLDLVDPKHPYRLPTMFSEEEVARLLASANSSYHFVILMILYSTGVRRAELCRIHRDTCRILRQEIAAAGIG